MPGGNGTGPFGQGPGTGRGMGRRIGISGGMGRNRGNRAGAGPSGNCICPKCGAKATHDVGVPCSSVRCPKCNSLMIRE